MDRFTDNHRRPERPPRHCMVVHAHYPLGEIRVEREARALMEQGAEVDIICLKEMQEAAISLEAGARVHRLPVRRRLGRGAGAQLVEYLRFFFLAFVHLTILHLRNRYAVIQVHNLPDFLVFVALIPRLTGARVILDIHDLMPEFYAERFHHSMNSLLVRMVCWQEWLSCRFADRVITVTELWRQTLIKRGQPANKVAVVMNVADATIFFAGAAAHPNNNGHFRLIYHGNLVQRYGLDLLLRAVNQVRQTAPDICLTLHGRGEYYRALEKLTNELGLQNHVIFSAFGLSTSELPKLLMTADLAVVPYRDSLFTGGILPTKLMEYAALGIPAIAARTPAIAAYFDDTTVQFFTPGAVDELAACILALYRDRSRLADLARNIGRFNERYNWSQVSAQYVALVKQLQAR